MNKIEKLAEVKFDGDIEKAIDYLFRNGTKEAQSSFFKDFTPEQKQITVKVVEEQLKPFGGTDGIMREEVIKAELNLTEDEIANAKRNPYLTKMGKIIIGMLLTQAGVIAAEIYISNPVIQQSIQIALGGISISLAVVLVNNIRRCIRFNKLKKMYNDPEYRERIKALQEGEKGRLSEEELFGEDSPIHGPEN